MSPLAKLREGIFVPACPLTLHEDGRWSKRHQRALLRYYIESGIGGLAVGVHSTQFAIRDPKHGLYEPLLEFASQTLDEFQDAQQPPLVKIAGVCGETSAALHEVELARQYDYHAALLSLPKSVSHTEESLLEHCRSIAAEIPVIGFYLQPAVGGRMLSYDFWRAFAEIEQVVAIKIAPFNRYQTLDVIRAVMEHQRFDIAFYTGNDDSIIFDLITPWNFAGQTRWMDGGLLGHWGVWTRPAVELFAAIRRDRHCPDKLQMWLQLAPQVTDLNAALFDPAHQFSGCIPGIMEVLRRNGLAPSNRCLDPAERLSPGQQAELDRVEQAYPNLVDNHWIQENLSRWLS